MTKILIVGAGKVGSATRAALSHPLVDFHDPIKGYQQDNFADYDLIFVCVDTMQEGAEDDLHIKSALNLIKYRGYKGVVAIRSTLNPVWVPYFEELYPFSIVLFPEFMVQRGDVINDQPWSVVLGGKYEDTLYVADVLEAGGYYKPGVTPIQFVSAVEAAMIKISTNAALASKVIMANAIYLACKQVGAEYGQVKIALGLDDRIGEGHLTVPSPDDGKLGFGGHCLPKDIFAMINLDQTGYFETVTNINWELGR